MLFDYLTTSNLIWPSFRLFSNLILASTLSLWRLVLALKSAKENLSIEVRQK
jgi:hypothetical protein